jgi:HEAT repeat protein
VSLSAALEAFRDQHVEVRRAVAFTLGEWADETTVEVLSQIAEADPESSVRGEAIDALGKIGGLQAVECLKTASSSPGPRC